jgi:hypothetical protein
MSFDIVVTLLSADEARVGWSAPGRRLQPMSINVEGLIASRVEEGQC